MAEDRQMSMEEFRQSRATTSASKAGGKNSNPLGKHSSSNLNKKMSPSRPSSGSAKTNPKEGNKLDVKSLEEKCERAKLLREKQSEERKRKNNERIAAVEERRRQKEREESRKNETLRHLLEHKSTQGSKGPRTGRKLPNLPVEGSPKRETLAMRRLSSGSSSSESSGHTPPGSAKGTKASRRNLTGPSSASTSCLSNVENGRVKCRTKSNLAMSKKTSSSTNNLTEKSSTNNSKPAAKAKGKSMVSHSLGVPGLPKARSTGAIHQVGQGSSRHHSSRPASGGKHRSKSTTSHHAGTDNEQEAKLALAEHRRRVREEAERKALLDKEKQEQLRKQREEEERRLAEENARATARQQELAKLLKEQEEERARLLREEQEREEAKRIEAEMKRKEEMEIMRKQELERRAKEAEKREKEEEERLKREEEERQERRKRVEMIMSRTRMTAATNNNSFKSEGYSSQEELSSDESKYHSTTVSEILQKVKEKSRASPNPEQDAEKHKENQEVQESPGKDQVDGQNDKTAAVLRTRNDTSKLDSLISGNNDGDTQYDKVSTNIVSLPLRQHDTDGKVKVSKEAGDEDVGGKVDLINSISRDTVVTEVTKRDDELWKNVENFMQSSESHARDNLERNGAIAEDEDDEDGEEGQLWKVVEGRREISEVV